MIEIVIPTLWKSEKINEMLPKYEASPYVSMIHIMDNGQEWNARYGDKFPIGKIRVYTPSVYNKWMINEAWNIGVQASSANSIIAVLNDDIIFNVNVFEWIVEHSGELGILGMHEDNYKLEEDGEYEIVDLERHTYGWGCGFFFEKRNWSIIPPQLKLYFGDTWQFSMNETPCKALKGLSMKDSNISATNAREEFFAEFNEKYLFERTWFMQNVQHENPNLGYRRE